MKNNKCRQAPKTLRGVCVFDKKAVIYKTYYVRKT